MGELSSIEEWLSSERHIDVESPEDKMKVRLDNILLSNELKKLDSERNSFENEEDEEKDE